MFVTGCHRSGTSLLASVLADALSLDRKTDLDPAIDNPRGFFETRQLMEFNDRLLAGVGADWSHPPLFSPRWGEGSLFDLIVSERPCFKHYALNHHWLDKDPRLCLTRQAFGHLLLRRVPLIAAFRPPLDVAQSLYYRNGFPLEYGLALWFLYNYHLANSLGPGDQIISYSLMIQAVDCDEFSSELAKQLNLFLGTHADSVIPLQRWHEIFRERVDPDLRRAHTGDPNPPSVNALLLSSLEDLYTVARNGVDSFRAAFFAIPQPILELFHRIDIVTWPDRNHFLNENRELSNQIQELYHSRSWRLTAPLRWLSSRRG